MKLLSKKQKASEDDWRNRLADFSVAKNILAPSIIDERDDHVQLGENFVRTLVITDFPSSVEAGWLRKIYSFKGNVTISTHYVPKPPEKMIKLFSNSIKEYDSRLNRALEPDKEVETENEKEDAIMMLKKLKKGDNNIVYDIHLYVQLQADSLEELDYLTDNLRRELWGVGLTHHIPKTNMYKAFESCLPIMKNELPEYTRKMMDCVAASTLFQFDEAEIFENSGIIKGRTFGSHSPVLINLYQLNNFNEFILGSAGSGKTYAMKVDILRHFMQGFRIFIIDPEGEYKKLVKKNGGQHIVLSNNSKTIINPLEILHSNVERLDLEKDEDSDYENETKQISPLHNKIQRLKIFFKQIKPDLTSLEAALITGFLRKTYKNNTPSITPDMDFSKLTSEDFPTLKDFYQLIKDSGEERLADFKAILKTYVEDDDNTMFNGHTNVNLNSQMICFDLSYLEDESDSQGAAMFNVLSYLWDEITKEDKALKRLYVDEAHVLADPANPRAMRFLHKIYKRIRKYQGGVTAATQQISDFLTAIEGKRNYGKAIIGNSQSKLILGLESTDIHDLKTNKVLQLSEQEERILSSKKRGEGIFISGNRRVHMMVEATSKEMELIDPKQWAKKYGSAI